MRAPLQSSSASKTRLTHMQQEVDTLRADILQTVSDDVRAVLQESLRARIALLQTRGSTIARWAA